MGQETSKAVARRLRDSRFLTRYLVGDGIDIGSGNDPFGPWCVHFPGVRSIVCWDKEQGDAEAMEGVDDARFDFVMSSHCLEHLHDPWRALRNWARILKPGGYMIVVVPDWQLYEQGQWPSRFNPDHKRRFGIGRREGVVDYVDVLRMMPAGMWLLRVELLDAVYFHGRVGIDQAAIPGVEPAIEMVAVKQ